MTDLRTPDSPTEARPVAAYRIGGAWLDALAHRDLERMARALDPDLHFRGLMPARDIDTFGPDAAMAEFTRWFGDPDESFEVVDATMGEVGPRLYLRWRVRLTSTTTGRVRVVEQHAYLEGTERIEVMRLMCSGFVVEGAD